MKFKIFIQIICILLLSSPFNYAQVWQKSYTAGNTDGNGKYMGGSEIMHLVNHKGRLYAATGYYQDALNVWFGGTDNNKGWGQIIRLDSANGSWQVDMEMQSFQARPEIIKQLVFTKDSLGNNLSTPDTVLFCATYSADYANGIIHANAYTRDDITGQWTKSLIHQGPPPALQAYSIRDVEIFEDKVTGIEKVFITVGTKGVFTGLYSPNTPEKISWNSTAEFNVMAIRPLGIASANDTLYISSGAALYARIDGPNPLWTVYHNFSDLTPNISYDKGGIRGLTTIPNPNGPDEALLLMWCPGTFSSGKIFRLEPNGIGGFQRTLEAEAAQLVHTYLPGSGVDQVIGAYNNFYDIGNGQHLVGFQARFSSSGQPKMNGYFRGAFFATRSTNAQYVLEEVDGPISQTDSPLIAPRCYISSPFPGENAIYFGGYAANNILSTDKAWIYKKTIAPIGLAQQASNKKSFNIYPSPARAMLFVQGITSKVSYKIRSLTGDLILNGQLDRNKNQIDISTLKPQVYFIQIDDETIKFLKTD